MSRIGDEATRRWVQAAKAGDALTSERGRRALRLGVAASREHRGVLRRLAPRTVIDVGANRGQFALEVRRTVPSATVLSFEPLPAAADVYERVFAGDDAVALHRCALAADAGRVELHVSQADDSSSLLAITDEQARLFPGTEEVATVEVEQATLDGVLGATELDGPVLLKIDVQGGELDVLRGGPRTLERVRWVYVECSFQELYAGQPLAHVVIDHLASAGLRLQGLGPVSTVGGEAIQADLLFSRP